MGKRKCFQQIVLVKLDIHTQKKGSVVYVDLYLTLSIKINSKCIKKKLPDLGFSNNFLAVTPRSIGNKRKKVNKLHFTKI